MANNPPYSNMQSLQPPPVSSMDPPRNFIPPMPMQFRPVIPAQQPQQFIPVASQHFQHVGRGVSVNTGLPSHPSHPQYPQQLPGRPAQPGPGLPNALPNGHVTPGSLPPPTVQAPINYAPSLAGPGAPLPSPYTFVPPSYQQPPVAFGSVTQYQPMTQLHAPNIPAGGQAGPPLNQSTVNVTPVQPNGEQSSATATGASTVDVQPTMPVEVPVTDWKEHVSADGRRCIVKAKWWAKHLVWTQTQHADKRNTDVAMTCHSTVDELRPTNNFPDIIEKLYYHNKRTRQSTWEKPFDLMTPIERADASTDWKEHTSTDGRKYYYNKVTKQSKWEFPEELKLARERIEKPSTEEPQAEALEDSHSHASVFPAVDKTVPDVDASSITDQAELSSHVFVAPIVASGNSESWSVLESSASHAQASSVASDPNETKKADIPISGVFEVTATGVDTATTKIDNSGNFSGADGRSSADTASTKSKEEAAKDVPITETFTNISSEEKAVSQEPLTYADKLEAKNAFKSLLESANVGSDSTWEQAMRLIINDRRYGALKTLGERKQAFNEYLGQKKKQDAEERRMKQKRAREEFRNMLEEARELTPATKLSKAVSIFESDERFKAVERERDRKELIDAFLQELGEKEKAKIQEERKQNLAEYRKFLESCDFIKANTQWRKVQDRLEADERCNRLENIDRLEIFQEYLCDLDKEEEEQRKIQKEELRKAERKNRDEFRKLLEEHVTAGTLTAKTNWHDYHLKVKDLPAYMAVSSNSSGSTPKDLYEDVAEELQKQYQEDKSWVKDAVKLKKVALASTWTFEDFKAAIMDDASSPTISDVNRKIIFEELVERAKEKEEKEAKKRRRYSEDFLNLLHSIKEITAFSEWENCIELFEGSREFSSIGDESICKEIFEEYISQLKENVKEYERKRKDEKAKKEKEREERERRKGKHRKEREREREHSKKEEADSENIEFAEDHINDGKRSASDSYKKQRRQHRDLLDDSEDDEKDKSRSSHRHSNDHKKSRRRASTPDSDGESRHKRHRRDNRNGSRRNGSHDELEDGEFGETQ